MTVVQAVLQYYLILIYKLFASYTFQDPMLPLCLVGLCIHSQFVQNQGSLFIPLICSFIYVTMFSRMGKLSYKKGRMLVETFKLIL